MKHLYDNQDDDMRSKLNGHEFDLPNGAWKGMENKLNRLEVPNMSKSLAPWLSLGVMCIGIAGLLYYYQLQMPYGKLEKVVQTEAKNTDHKESGKSELQKEVVERNSDNSRKTTISEIYVDDASIVTNSNGSSKAAQNRIIEPAVHTHSIKSERVNLSELPKKLDPIAYSPTYDYNSNGNFIVDLKSKNESVSSKAFHNEKSPESDAKFAEKPLITNVLILENKPVLQINKMIDTPLLVLKTPHFAPVKRTKFGLSAGINAKIFADNDLSIAPAAGIFVRRYLNSRFALGADLQYKMLLKNRHNKPEGADLMTLQMDVDPSEEILMHNKTAEVYSMKTVHMLELPLSFVYRLHKKHNVSLGINTAFIFGVKTANADINNLSEKELGFSSLDLGALATYEFNLNKNISLAVTYNVGFLNLVRNVGSRQQEMIDANPAYRMNNNETDEACLMPVQLNNQEQVFFEAPTNLYNNDAKVMLRYSF
jgi:hypothetical protein